MAPATDVRSIPDWLLNAYRAPAALWGLAYGALYFTSRDAYAIPLLYPLAAWQIALTIWWAANSLRRLRSAELTMPEVDAGVRTIGGIAAGAAILPAVVFIVNDPLASEAHGTAFGVIVVAGVAYGAVRLGERLANPVGHLAVLTFALLALPINATGAVTIASMRGWFDQVAQPSLEIMDRSLPGP
ncbi:MAG: hypothetical protein H0V89_00050 [Deltaproteobacteria bacterium]|nr:hypothetical protein [Deltaproteobacteria bacterium]